MQAKPLQGVVEALDTIRRDASTALYVISGRPANEAAELLNELPIPVIGSHGYDYRSPDGKIEVYYLNDREKNLLHEAEEVARSSNLTRHLERKTASIALHTRGLTLKMAKAYEANVIRLWEPLSLKGAVELLEFNGGVELRAKGRDKGTVFADIYKLMPKGTFAVYIGDDETDEDAFRAIRPVGAGIKVGGREDEHTDASYRLKDCHEVLLFLRAWPVKGANQEGGA
jgi:trehalose-phosphatase